MNQRNTNAVGLPCAVCGEKIVIATEGAGCTECSHPHHFDCGCVVKAAAPPSPLQERVGQSISKSYSPGLLLSTVGILLAGGAAWALLNLRELLESSNSMPLILVAAPLLVAPWFLIFGGWMLAQGLSFAGLKTAAPRTGQVLTFTSIAATFLCGAFLVYLLVVHFPDVELIDVPASDPGPSLGWV